MLTGKEHPEAEDNGKAQGWNWTHFLDGRDVRLRIRFTSSINCAVDL